MKNILHNWIIPILHLLLILLSWVTPWFIPWQFIIIIFILYRLQLIIFKGCILSHAQFSDKKEGFYYHYLKRIYPDIKNSTIDMVVDTIIPIIIILIALLIQR